MEKKKYTVRKGEPHDLVTIEALWSASQDADTAAFRPSSGWWSLVAWADETRLLLADHEPIGVVAVVFDERGYVEARLALAPVHREKEAADLLIEQVTALAAEAGRAQIRLSIPSLAQWALEAARRHGYTPLRAIHMMLRPALEGRLPVATLEDVQIRRIRPDEDLAVLNALNRAWSTTWNFRPIKLESLEADLRGQRDGFFVATPKTDEAQIVGTVHALFDPTAQNPDQQPYAWISNLTVDQSQRGKGLGRILLATGINYLKEKGAGSIALGVDGGSIAPMKLYRSVHFEVIRTVDILQYVLTSDEMATDRRGSTALA
ncbi:acetyltransferase (GNAT) family protein [Thermosporothrix hazakensis]|jgi:mycothiol synthase|uniref:Acetyltransferase (GNAT) family protein n=1 Tax=Thermosporothrix hazakensis TaxID=644383 RepID=A0A326U7P5_THEHA|nr:GNAT family N-acetyltransferase [Thermosporothrix hazakensis]PZW31108.1 acetyltransferase (GNAT) family protein [Thermosporothrix hazakensis]GCE50978.1 hypothetical protein KTH_58470 [Thermosporothrix hazakensis]